MNNWRQVGVVMSVLILLSAVGIAKFSPAETLRESTSVSYICRAGNVITATYTRGGHKPSPSPDQPPIPGGRVTLRFSDGQVKNLLQTISADGVRYASADEAFVFWNKGNKVIVLEGDEEKTFSGCIAIARESGPIALPRVFVSDKRDFSIRLPEGFRSDTKYQYHLNPVTSLTGAKFTIAPSIAKGTNLAGDTFVSVERISQTTACTADLFFTQETASVEIIEGEATYSVASTTEAGAGNRYSETVYALPGTNPCIGIRYFVHYGAIENYPPGTVRSFDARALYQQFDAIRRTLTVAQ